MSKFNQCHYLSTFAKGGTIRDAAFLSKQPFWTEETEYLGISAVGAVIAFYLTQRDGNDVERERDDEWFFSDGARRWARLRWRCDLLCAAASSLHSDGPVVVVGHGQ